jgi:hypothetical protein
MEQGQMLPASTFCGECGLTAYELLLDAVFCSSGLASLDDVSGNGPKPSRQRLAVQDMNLLFSGVGLDLDSGVEV